MKLVRGDQLTPAARTAVLRAFFYRWTSDNPRRAEVYAPLTALGHQPPTAPLVSDEEWLREHSFWIKKDGTLSTSRRYAEPAFLAS